MLYVMNVHCELNQKGTLLLGISASLPSDDSYPDRFLSRPTTTLPELCCVHIACTCTHRTSCASEIIMCFMSLFFGTKSLNTLISIVSESFLAVIDLKKANFVPDVTFL